MEHKDEDVDVGLYNEDEDGMNLSFIDKYNVHIDPTGFGVHHALMRGYEFNRVMRNISIVNWRSELRSKNTIKDFFEEVQELVGLCVYNSIGEAIFLNPKGIFRIAENSFTRDKENNKIYYISFNISTEDHILLAKVKEWCSRQKGEIKQVEKDLVYTLFVDAFGKLCFDPIGFGEKKLIRTNYAKEALEGIDYIVNQLQSENQFGKIFILKGEPGTGKTNAIQGIIDSCDKCCFVIVPSHMIREIGNPSFLKAIVSFKRNLDEEEDTVEVDPLTGQLHFNEQSGSDVLAKKIILILEDADDLLVCREVTDKAALSNLLNFSDGIIGNILDLTMICTTNARDLEFDEAVMRPGRLGRQVDVNALTFEEASEAFKVITEGKNLKDYTTKSFLTLAEVYAFSREANIGVTPKKVRKLGF